MDFKINFFFKSALFNSAVRPRLANVNCSFPLLTSRVNEFGKGFFSRFFSFRIPKTLMDSFYRSAAFYNRFPQLRPTFSNSFYSTIKFAQFTHLK